jgi:hypothetical protein
MKRADHHNVSPVLPLQENLDTIESKDEQLQLEELVPHHTDAPTMGALPADSLGSGESKTGWKTTELEETHSSDDESEDSVSNNEVVAVGTGPDPDNFSE